MWERVYKIIKILRRLSIPLAIVVGAGFLAIAIYAVQVNKQQSIERQQRLENERADLKLKQDECESLSAGVKKKWNNVMGVTYDKIWDECVVTYTDTKTGEVETSPLKYMQDIK